MVFKLLRENRIKYSSPHTMTFSFVWIYTYIPLQFHNLELDLFYFQFLLFHIYFGALYTQQKFPFVQSLNILW